MMQALFPFDASYSCRSTVTVTAVAKMLVYEGTYILTIIKCSTGITNDKNPNKVSEKKI